MTWLLTFLLCFGISMADAEVRHGVADALYASLPSDENWERATPATASHGIMQNVPVEQNGLIPEELDQVEILSKYRVNAHISGIAYYDKESNMLCHVTTDVNLLRPMALSCSTPPNTKTVKGK